MKKQQLVILGVVIVLILVLICGYKYYTKYQEGLTFTVVKQNCPGTSGGSAAPPSMPMQGPYMINPTVPSVPSGMGSASMTHLDTANYTASMPMWSMQSYSQPSYDNSNTYSGVGGFYYKGVQNQQGGSSLTGTTNMNEPAPAGTANPAPAGGLAGGTGGGLASGPIFANYTGDLWGFGVGESGLIGQAMCAVKTNDTTLPDYIFIGKDNTAWRMVSGSIDANNNFTRVTSKQNSTDFDQTLTSPSDVIELYNSSNSTELSGPTASDSRDYRYNIRTISNASCPSDGIFAQQSGASSTTSGAPSTPSGASSTPSGASSTPSGASSTTSGASSTPSGASSTPSGAPSTPSGASSTPSGASSTTSGAPSTPSGASSTPSGVPSTPSGASSTPSGVPSTPSGASTIVNLSGELYYYNMPAQKLCGIKTNDSSLPPYIFIGKDAASWRMFGGSLDDNNNFTITTYKYNNNLSQTVQTANDVVSLYNNNNSQAASDFDNKQVKDITSNSDACSSILSSSLQQVAPSGTAPSGTQQPIASRPVFANYTGDLWGFGVGESGLIGQAMCAVKTNDSTLPDYIFIGKDTAWRMVSGSIDANNNFTRITSKQNSTDFNQTLTSPSDVIALYNSSNSTELSGPTASDSRDYRYNIRTISNASCPSDGIFAQQSGASGTAPSGTAPLGTAPSAPAPLGTAPSAPAPNTSTSTLLPSNYQVYQDGVDCWGGDISGQSIQNSNLGECARKCDALPNCTGFSFGTNNSCKPKSFSPFPPNSASAKCDASSIDTFYKKN